jgi:molybdopterin-guanine dinucleotide biosynthesis protein A
MGAAKATVELAGRPLISYPIEAALAAGLDVAVVAKPTTPLPALDVEVWREPAAPQHPLQGLVMGLERAGDRPVLALGCDLPLVTSDLLRWLAGCGEGVAAVPVTGGRPQPLLARYAHEALGPLRRSLAGGQTLTAAVAGLSPRFISEAELLRFGDPAALTFNVNSPSDLRHAAALLSPRSRSSSAAAGETRVGPRGA